MTELFLKLVNMSIAAAWLVLAVMILRFVLKKSPRWVHVLLWGIVALRLMLPFSLESALSLIPSKETIPGDILTGPSFRVDTGIAPVDDSVNAYLGDRYYEGVTVPADNGVSVMSVLTAIWLLGMILMLLYTAVSYLRLRRSVGTAVRVGDDIFQSERIQAPFVLGIIRPRIYLPFATTEPAATYVIAHEQAHIQRKDHWWKPLGFFLLTVYWFNPVMWLGYILLCRDIEMACDEKVIAKLPKPQLADYSQALLSCSVNRRQIAACPLAFGEVSVKTRVKSVLSYKKPAFWIIIVAIILCVVVAVCFLTDPLSPQKAFHRWMMDLTMNDVASVSVWSNQTAEDTVLEAEETEAFLKLLHRVKSTDLEENKHLSGITPDYGLVLTLRDGTCLYWNESGKAGTVEVGFGGALWWIHSTELENFVEQMFLNAEGTEPVKRMSLQDVIELSKLGTDLTRSDLASYKYQIISSGLYICQYEIDSEYALLVGEDDAEGKPEYVRLYAVGTGEQMDIRTGDVEVFIREQMQLRDKLAVRADDKRMLQSAEGSTAVYTWGFGIENSVFISGAGERQITLSCAGQVELGGYKIYLTDGTVYDDGTREIYDSLSLRVMVGDRLALLTPYEPGAYIYELSLYWPQYDKTMIYGLQVILTESDQTHLEPTVNGEPKEGPEYDTFLPLALISGYDIDEIKALLINAPREKVQWSWGMPDMIIDSENASVYRIPDSDAAIYLFCNTDGTILNVQIKYHNGILQP